MRSLESLGIKPDDNPSLSMVLLPIFDTKLPRELKKKWELELTNKEAPDDTKGSLPKHKRRYDKGRKGKDEENMSAQSLMGASESKKMKCGFCEKNHESWKCPVALTKTTDERWEMLMKRKGAPTCFNCLQPGSIAHNARTCKAPRCPVDGCGKKHHQLLHSADQTRPNDEETQTLSGFVSMCKQNLLPTACARMIYEGKECSVHILLDSGSQETFLRTAVADNLNTRRHGSPTNMKIKVLGAVDVDVTRCNHLRNLKLADNFPRKAATVDLLVGADQYYKLVQGSIKRGRPGTPIATKSRLGWLLSGPVPGSTCKKGEETTAMLTVTKMYNAHDQLNAIGIVDQQRGETTAEQKDVVDQFNNTCQFDGERYEVGLPWKRDHPHLVDNYEQAYQRLVSTERSLVKNPEDENVLSKAAARSRTCSNQIQMPQVQKHAKEYEEEYPVAAKEVNENMYVDDVLSGAPDDDSALQLKDELCGLLSKGGFQLTKWASNSQKVMETTPLHERAPTLVPTTEPKKMLDSSKALETSWNTQDDALMFTNGSSIF
ncbi:hypothetical protein ACROYT_G025484 [Oculina patagonica]